MAIVVRGDDPEGGWQEPEEAAAITRAQTSPGLSAALSGFAHDNSSEYLMRRAERSQFDPSDWFFDMLAGNAAAYGAPADQLPQRVQSPTMEPEKYNDLYAPRDDTGNIVPIGDKPMPELLAKTIGQQMKDKQVADSAISRFENSHGFVTNSLVSMAAGMADPLNIAANMLPVVGEEAMAARLGLTGASILSRTAARAASGAVVGAATQAPLAALRAGLAPGENDEYGMADALRDTLEGTASMAAMATGLGSVGDLLKVVLGRPTTWHLEPAQTRATLPDAAAVVTADAATNQAAQRSALAQVIDGKPVDVEDLFPKPPGSMTATGLFTEPMTGTANVTGMTDFIAPQYDRDQVARQLEPDLFSQFDDATARRAWHSSLYHELVSRYQTEPTAATDAGRQVIQDQIDALMERMQSVTKSQRAGLAQQISGLREQLAERSANASQEALQLGGAVEEPAAPATTAIEPLPPQVTQPLPQGSIADIDTEINRLQGELATANRTGGDKITARIDRLRDQQQQLADAIGVPNLAPEVGPERFAEAPMEAQRGATPFVNVPARPMSLVEWLATQGGVRDQNGDIAHIVDHPNFKPLAKAKGGVAGLNPEDRFKRLIHDNGMDLDHAAERAQEEGYFPEKPDRYTQEATPHDLIEAIREEMAGHRRYSREDEAMWAQHHAALEHNAEIGLLADIHDIDPRGMTREQFFNRVAERQSFAELENDLERRLYDYRDRRGEHDLEPGDLIEHPEHGTMMYEGPRSLEDLENVERQAQGSAGGRPGELPANTGQPGVVTGRAELGEANAGQGGRAVGAERGAGTEARNTAAGAGAAVGRRGGVTATDLRVVQRGLVAADLRARDLAVRVSDAYRRADELIRQRVERQTGNIISEIYPRNSQGSPLPLSWNTDLGGMLEREKAWRDTGVAPGVGHAELRDVQQQVAEAAARPAGPDDPAQLAEKTEKPPGGWGRGEAHAEEGTEKPAGEAVVGEAKAGATSGPEKETAPVDPLQRLQAEHPDLDIMGMSQPEKDELLAVQAEVDRAELMKGAYEEAANCLTAAGM